RVAAEKERFGNAVAIAADYPDSFVGHLISVANRAVADEAASQRLVVKPFVHWRGPIGDAGGEEDCAGDRLARSPPRGGESRLLVTLELGHELSFNLRAIFARLIPHALEQLGALDPIGKAGDIA